jgi:uncharacterized protein
VQSVDKPLTEAELDALEQFLDERFQADHGMLLSMTDGFMTALASGPIPVSASDWLGDAFTTDELPANSAPTRKSEKMVALILRRYREIITTLEEATPDLLLSGVEASEEHPELIAGEMWCFGYVRGMSARDHAWDGLLGDEQAAEMVSDIFLLASPFLVGENEDSESPAAEAFAEYKSLTLTERSEIAKSLITSVVDIYDYWEEERIKNAELHKAKPIIHTEPKVGRNDPCVCGSGKKSKRCCG